MILRIILLAQISLSPIEIADFLHSKNLPGKVKVELIDLSKRELGTQEQYFLRLRAAFLAGKKNTIVITDDFEGWTLGNTSRSFSHVACSNREDRREHCLVAIGHELLHQMGYKHSKERCKDILDADVLSCENLSELEFKH